MAITGRGSRIRSTWITTRTAAPQFAPATSGDELQTSIGDFAFEAAGASTTTFTYAGAIACSSAIAAPVSKTKAPAVSIAGSSTVAAPLAKTKSPAVAIAGASSVAAVLSKTKTPAASIPAASTIAAGLAKTKAPAVAIAGASSVQAPVSTTKVYAGQVAGASAVASSSSLTPATPTSTFTYGGQVNASSALAAAVARTRAPLVSIDTFAGVQAGLAKTKAAETTIAASSSVAALLAKSKAFAGQVAGVSDPTAAAYRYVDATAPVAHVYAGQVSATAAVQALVAAELIVPISTGGGGHSSRSQGPAASRPGYHLAGPYLAPVSHAARMFGAAAGVAFSRTTIAARVAFVPAAVIQEANREPRAESREPLGGVYLVPPAPDVRPIAESRERVVVWRSPRPTRTFIAIGAIAARAPRPTSSTSYEPDPILERARADDADALLAILESLEC